MSSKPSASTGIGAFLALVGLALVLLSMFLAVTQRTETPEPAPTPGVEAIAGELRTVPDVDPGRRRAIQRELAKTLRLLYERAFVTELPPPSPAASPVGPSYRIDDLLTSQARKAIRAKPDIFLLPPDLSVTRGKVTFRGMTTVKGSQPLEAFLEVDFFAQGTPEGRITPIVRVRQRGTIILVRTSGGWRVQGFDLKLATRPVLSPSPSPS